LIPEGALKGVQFVKAPSYVQVVGYIDQSKINIAHGDYGGEMDPHGADRRGNPLGGLVFSTAFGANNGSQWTQAIIIIANTSLIELVAITSEWHFWLVIGRHCCRTLLIGVVSRSAPASYDEIEGKFESCLSDNQRYPGVYVNNAGQTVT
jgi:hypothetical protein